MADTLTVIGMIVIPIVSAAIGIWLAGFTALKTEAKKRGMTYSEYIEFRGERRKR